MNLTITNDDEAHEVLSKYLEGTLSDDIEIEFKGWPKKEIIIRGESFDGGVPTRIMPVLIRIQKEIDRFYLDTVYKGEKRKRLTKDEKKITEVIVRVEDGHSTLFKVELDEILNTIIQGVTNKMSGNQIATTIISLAIISGAAYVSTSYWQQILDERKIEHDLQISENQIKHVETITKIAANNPTVERVLENQGKLIDALVKTLDDKDQLILDDQVVTDGETARLALKKLRPEPIESRLDGEFLIEFVDTKAVEDGFRLKVRKTDENEPITIDIPAGTLNKEQTEILQSGEWGKTAVKMRINLRKIGNRITKATLIEAGLSK